MVRIYIYVLWIVGLMLLSLPSYMEFLFSTFGMTQKEPGVIMSFLNALCYFMAVYFLIDGALAYKNESRRVVEEHETSPPKIKNIPVKSVTFEKKLIKEIPLNRTNDKDVDRMIVLIEIKGRALMAVPHNKKNTYAKDMIDTLLEGDLPKVIAEYKATFVDVHNSTPRTVAIQKLENILDRLDDIEENLLARSHDILRVNEKIVNGLFKKSEYELDM